MYHDYKYLSMAAQNEERTASDMPYILVNSATFYVKCTSLKDLLHETPKDKRQNELESIKEFTSRLDGSKAIWRTVAEANDQKLSLTHRCNTGILLSTATHSTMVNTGIEKLTVGDKFYALPAIEYLSKNYPVVNTFTYGDKMYLHPMLLSSENYRRLLGELINVHYDRKNAKTDTMIGNMISNLIDKNGDDSIDLGKIVEYMLTMKPVGVVVHSIDTQRRSIYSITTTKVALGSEFVCRNAQYYS